MLIDALPSTAILPFYLVVGFGVGVGVLGVAVRPF